jgi:hypothetical protein
MNVNVPATLAEVQFLPPTEFKPPDATTLVAGDLLPTCRQADSRA